MAFYVNGLHDEYHFVFGSTPMKLNEHNFAKFDK